MSGEIQLNISTTLAPDTASDKELPDDADESILAPDTPVESLDQSIPPANHEPTVAESDKTPSSDHKITDEITPASPIPETPLPSCQTTDINNENQPEILRKILEKLETVESKLETVEKKVEMIPELKSSIDSMNTSLKILDTRLFDAERTLEKCNERLCSLETNVGRLQTNTVKQGEFDSKMAIVEANQKKLSDELFSLKSQMSKSGTPNEKPIDVELLKQQIRESLLSEMSSKPRQHKTSPPTSNHTNLSKLPADLRGKLTEDEQVINNLNHDLLIIGDSNTHPIKENIIKHGVPAAKILAITIDDAINAVQNVPFSKEPKKIMVHTATNHFPSRADGPQNGQNLLTAKAKLETLFSLLEKKFPSSEVFVSELFIRGEKSLGKYIDDVNDYFRSACRKRENFRVLRHSTNIDSDKYLRDDKHLSRIGFSIFLRNIRFQMYDMIPMFRQGPQFRPRK